jgi:hypothetical protein
MLTLDQCLNKTVLCADGALRRLRKITYRTLEYDVPTSKDDWVSMGGTPRREVQERFEKGVIQDE